MEEAEEIRRFGMAYARSGVLNGMVWYLRLEELNKIYPDPQVRVEDLTRGARSIELYHRAASVEGGFLYLFNGMVGI